jgi:hypothetical protein
MHGSIMRKRVRRIERGSFFSIDFLLGLSEYQVVGIRIAGHQAKDFS